MNFEKSKPVWQDFRGRDGEAREETSLHMCSIKEPEILRNHTKAQFSSILCSYDWTRNLSTSLVIYTFFAPDTLIICPQGQVVMVMAPYPLISKTYTPPHSPGPTR